MDTRIKFLFSALAIIMTLLAFIPYIRGILEGIIRPHMFSWFIWGSTTMIVFFAQLNAQGGVGAWPIGISGAITIYIASLAYRKRGDLSVTCTDWLFLIAAFSSLPFWYFTSNPLWAVVLLTTIDLLGFGPTIRKAYQYPHEENIPFFAMFLARNVFVLLALEAYSLTTILFPLSICLACLFLIALVWYRRKVVEKLV